MNTLQAFELGMAAGATVMTLVFYILSLDTGRYGESVSEYLGRKIRRAVWWLVFTPIGLFRIRRKVYDKNHKWAVKSISFNNNLVYYPNFMYAWREARADTSYRFHRKFCNRKPKHEDCDYIEDMED